MSSISHGKDAKRYHKSFAKASKSVFTISHLNGIIKARKKFACPNLIILHTKRCAKFIMYLSCKEFIETAVNV